VPGTYEGVFRIIYLSLGSLLNSKFIGTVHHSCSLCEWAELRWVPTENKRKRNPFSSDDVEKVPEQVQVKL